MKYIETDGFGLHRVELTRRNLLSLLAKLDGNPPNSACTLIDPDTKIAVRAVEDDVHYKAEGRAPGRMVGETEAVL